MIESQKKSKNVLILHSFHYPGKKKPGIFRKKPIWYEQYARDIGQELEKQDLIGVVVKESPKKRRFKRLRNKYNADWIVDLHSIAREYDPDLDRRLLAMIFCHSDPEISDYFKRFVNEYPKLNQTVQFPVPVYDDIESRYMRKYVGVELFDWIPKEKSIDFVKKLSQYLQTNDL